MCFNTTRNLLYFNEFILSNEGNAWGNIDTTFTETALSDDKSRMLNDLLNQCIHVILGIKVKNIKYDNMILQWGVDYQNMYYTYIRNIYFPTDNHLSVYDTTY